LALTVEEVDELIMELPPAGRSCRAEEAGADSG